ncbi:MAG TPA: alpha/beta hydrolase [Chloroflexota bacterium]|nr:alpha/beta hydrolase [Chloroflexota bacterium]
MSEAINRDIGGRATRILLAGAGQPVLWLHDTRGNRWTPGHERLSQHCRLIAPSLPGFDDSTTLGRIDGPEDVVFWLLDLLEALPLDRPVFLGCGLGGWLAAEFAVRYPERLSGLVLVNAYGLQVEGALPEDEFALTPPMLRPLVFADPTSALAQAWLPDSEPPEQLESALHARVAAARLAWQFPYSVKLRGRLPRARVRALVVWGAQDRLIPPLHARAYAEGLPDARLVFIPEAAHYPYIEAPERFAQVVCEFLADLSPAPSTGEVSGTR